MQQTYDVAIIGGGINGCGCAADAALRGLSVVLFEEGEIAGQTSSKSTKLIHGGLRYLEHFNFSLVKKALEERQILLQIAPHLVHPKPFVIPYEKSMRPLFFLRLGLFIYDHLSSKNTLPRSQLLTKKNHPEDFAPLQPHIKKGLLYFDTTTEDSLLTKANAQLAKEKGASIYTQTKLIKASPSENLWDLTLEIKPDTPLHIKAKSVINAAGPWVPSVSTLFGIQSKHTLSLIKGSHLIVKKCYEGEQAYVLQCTDKRIVFVIPYDGNTLIGTTELAFEGDPNHVHISPEETDYLLGVVNAYFNQRILPTDIIESYSGVRPLVHEEGKK